MRRPYKRVHTDNFLISSTIYLAEKLRCTNFTAYTMRGNVTNLSNITNSTNHQLVR